MGDQLALAAWFDVRTDVSGRTVLALLPVLLLLLGLMVYALVDLMRAPSVRYLPKPLWAVVIVLVSAPFGALAYLVFGRNRDGERTASPSGRPADLTGRARP